MSDLKALIFDVDGTLADTERDGHRVAFNLAFSESGLDWEWDVDLYGELLQVTGGKERIRFFIDTHQPALPSEIELDSFIATLHQRKTAHFLELMARGELPLRPGVERLLQEARSEGLRLAVATTTTVENVTTLLEQNLGQEAVDWFDVIAAGDVVPNKKPAPDIYHLALKELGLDAAECLALEDSEHGLHAAQGADLATLITINGYTREQDFSGALAVVDHLGDPDRPCRWLSGPAGESERVDVACLRTLHQGRMREAS